MKTYLVSWKTIEGYHSNGLFHADNLTELREQFIDCYGNSNQITDIREM